MRWALDPRSKERQAHINTIPVTNLKPAATSEVRELVLHPIYRQSCIFFRTSFLTFTDHYNVMFYILCTLNCRRKCSWRSSMSLSRRSSRSPNRNRRKTIKWWPGPGKVHVHQLLQSVQAARIPLQTLKNKPKHYCCQIHLRQM